MNNNYYVYSHISALDSKCFYIGVGKDYRVIADGRHRNKYWKRKVMNEGGYSFKILVNNISKRKALDLERSFINQIGLDNLTNIVGESGNSTAFKKGQVPWNKGLKNSQAPSTKTVQYDGMIFESVKSLKTHLGLSHTHFYRLIKQGKLDVVYLYNSYQKT